LSGSPTKRCDGFHETRIEQDDHFDSTFFGFSLAIFGFGPADENERQFRIDVAVVLSLLPVSALSPLRGEGESTGWFKGSMRELVGANSHPTLLSRGGEGESMPQERG
jgi:hypothetical protein